MLLDHVIALVRESDRTGTARALGQYLGGHSVIVFVRDVTIKVLLPAPGFPQTLPGGRAWRELLEECVLRGESVTQELTPPGEHETVPACAIACGPDVAAVLLGTTTVSAKMRELCELLPILERTFVWERDAANAAVAEKMARQDAAHASELATTLDQLRGQLQGALTRADESLLELELANEQLSEQAAELETQSAELEAQAAELQELNASLELARDAAQSANHAKSEFLATMSHELRTPLNAINGHVELLDIGIYGSLTDAQHEALARINRSQRHLLSLISDILNYARIEAGKIEYRIVDVSLDSVLRDIGPMIEPQLHAKGLRYTVEKEENVVARADRQKLTQIVLNLLSNAVKFTDAQGWVTVNYSRLVERPDRVHLCVSDSGIGIPQEKIDAIFEPFVQVTTGRTGRSDGTGLGLAISRDLARGMGGELSATSTLGEGSVFTLELNAVPSPSPVLS